MGPYFIKSWVPIRSLFLGLKVPISFGNSAMGGEENLIFRQIYTPVWALNQMKISVKYFGPLKDLQAFIVIRSVIIFILWKNVAGALASAAPCVYDPLVGLVCTSLASLRSSECTDFSEAALAQFTCFPFFRNIQVS